MEIKKTISIITLFFLFLELFLSFILTIPELTNDLGRHILLGNIILHSGIVSKINLLSYAFGSYPFINSHWLSEVIFYIVDSFSGINGIILLTTLLGVLSFLIVYFLAIKNAKISLKNTFFVNLIALFYVFAFSERTSIRPEIFSYLLTSIFIYILYKNREKHTKLIFLLIPLEVLWVNLHIYFVIGITLVAIFLAEEIFKNRKNLKILANDNKTKTLLIVFLGVVLCSFINPNFYKGAIYPLIYSNNYGTTIFENLDLFSANLLPSPSPTLFVTDFLIIFVIFSLIFGKKSFLDIVLASVFILLGVYAIRNIPIFLLVTFPLVIERIKNVEFFEKRTLTLITIVIFAAFSYILLNRIFDLRTAWADNSYSREKALDFYVQNKINGPIYNNFEIGSYIAYRLFPKEKPFIDERPEAYPKDFLSNTYPLIESNSAYFALYDSKYQFNSAIITYYIGLPGAFTSIKNLIEDPKWKLIFVNDRVLIFVKNTKENKQLIDNYGMDKNTIKIANLPIDHDNLVNLAFLFDSLSFNKKSLEIYKLAYAKDSTDCYSLSKIIVLSKKLNEPTQVYLGKYREACGSVFLQ